MSFAAIAGALVGAGASTAQHSGWLNYSSAKSLNKKTAKQNAAIALNTAHTLALNQPSWQVQGLRAAGLNPILAANDFGNSSLPSVSGSVGSSGGGSIENPINTALHLSNMEKQNSNLDRQNELLSAEKKQVEANTLKTISEAQLNSARYANTHQDTLNKANTRGLSGPFAAANQVGQDAVKIGSKVVDAIKAIDKFGQERINQPVIDFVRRVGSRFSNSAKDFNKGSSTLSSPSPRMIHETRTPSFMPSRRKHN